MGNGVSEPLQQTPTVEEVIDSLKDVLNTTDLNVFVHIIKQVLEEKKSDEGSTRRNENVGMWEPYISSGAKFMYFINDHISKVQHKTDILGDSKAVGQILDFIGKSHWVAGVLSLIAYLMERFEKVSAIQAEALEILTKMVDLATTLNGLKDLMPEEEEKLKNAVLVVVQGSIMLVSQIYSEKSFRFLKTSVHSENMKAMSKRLDHIYTDITLAISKKHLAIATEHLAIATENAKGQPKLLSVRKPEYPKFAVGIENAETQVIKLLSMTPKDESVRVVVIYGFGGIGKTTLANSVVAKLNLESYNYASVLLDEDRMSKNELKKMQEILLRDAFTDFHSGDRIELRNCEEGRQLLKEAFQCIKNKPVFLFLDNALRSRDLKELLPEDLSDLPKQSRILVTTRMLAATDHFVINGHTLCPFPVETLNDDHAIEILSKDSHNFEQIKDDMGKILKICGGVPLALIIVRGMIKSGLKVTKFRQMIDALQTRDYVEAENLSGLAFDFAYNELEDGTKDALLDICCFFNGWIRRHVEYVVGIEEVKSLEEAGLITSFLGDAENVRDDADRLRGLASLDFFLPIYDGEERLIVHDIMRARGRSMSTSNRFMNVESFCQAAQDETKLNGIKGLWFFDLNKKYVLDVKHLNSMRHSLRILCLVGETETSAPSLMNFKELRYLEVGVPSMKLEELNMLRMYIGPTNSMSKWPKRLRMIRSFEDMEESSSTEDIQNYSTIWDVESSQWLSMIRRFIVQLFRMWGVIVQRLATLEALSSTQGIQDDSLEELICKSKSIHMHGLHQLSSLKILFIFLGEAEELPEQVCRLSSLTTLFIWGHQF